MSVLCIGIIKVLWIIKVLLIVKNKNIRDRINYFLFCLFCCWFSILIKFRSLVDNRRIMKEYKVGKLFLVLKLNNCKVEVNKVLGKYLKLIVKIFVESSNLRIKSSVFVVFLG